MTHPARSANPSFTIAMAYAEQRRHTFSTRFGDTLHEKIKERAEQTHRSQADIVNEAVAAYFAPAPSCESCPLRQAVQRAAPDSPPSLWGEFLSKLKGGHFAVA